MKFYFLLTGIIALMLVLAGVVMAGTESTMTTSATVTVNEFLSATLTSGYPVAFAGADPGVPKTATVDPLVVTVGSETNVVYDITTKADATTFSCTTSAQCGTNSFAVSAMKWSKTATGGETAYTSSEAIVYDNEATPGNKPIYHDITIPSAQAAGPYSVGIIITAKK